MGISTGLDLDKLVACAALAEEIFGRALPGHLSKGGLFRAKRPVSWVQSIA
jgi:hydroxymethylglutaryl-CoA lyase